MNGETTRDLLLILVMAMVTFATRLLPFLLFDRGEEPPKAVLYLGRVLPPVIMAMLIVYCLKGVSFATPAGWVPALLSCGRGSSSICGRGKICSPTSEGRSWIWPWSRAC